MDRIEEIRQRAEDGRPIRRIDIKYLISEVERLAARAEKAEVGLSEAVAAMKLIADEYREKVGDDGICGLCKQDADHGPDGYANECAGFYKDDCFEWHGVKGTECGKFD